MYSFYLLQYNKTSLSNREILKPKINCMYVNKKGQPL